MHICFMKGSSELLMHRQVHLRRNWGTESTLHPLWMSHEFSTTESENSVQSRVPEDSGKKKVEWAGRHWLRRGERVFWVESGFPVLSTVVLRLYSQHAMILSQSSPPLGKIILRGRSWAWDTEATSNSVVGGIAGWRIFVLETFSVGEPMKIFGKTIKSCCRKCTRRGRVWEALDTQCVSMVTRSSSSVSQVHRPHPAEVLQERAGSIQGPCSSSSFNVQGLTLLNISCVTMPVSLSFLPTSLLPPILESMARPGNFHLPQAVCWCFVQFVWKCSGFSLYIKTMEILFGKEVPPQERQIRDLLDKDLIDTNWLLKLACLNTVFHLMAILLWQPV